MSQFTIKIEAPEIANAILALAQALTSAPKQVVSIETKEVVKEVKKDVEIASEPTIQADPLPTEFERINATAKVEKVTLEQIRGVLAGKPKVKVKALINKFGGSKLTEINPDTYPAMLKEAEAL